MPRIMSARIAMFPTEESTAIKGPKNVTFAKAKSRIPNTKLNATSRIKRARPWFMW